MIYPGLPLNSPLLAPIHSTSMAFTSLAAQLMCAVGKEVRTDANTTDEV